MSKPNFIIFYPDSLRAESLSIYGNTQLSTPNFERIATQGVVFENAFVQNPVCTPSRISMMTGRYVHNDGHRSLYHSIRNHEKSLLQYLKADGYEIGWFGKNDLYAPDVIDGLDPWVTEYSPNDAPVNASNNPYDQNDPRYFSFLREPSYAGLPEKSEQEVNSAIRFIRKMTEEQRAFCAYIPIGIPHVPFYAPPEYHHMYDHIDIGSVKPTPDQPRPLYYNLIKKYRSLHKLNAHHFESMRDIYAGMCSFADMLLGKILDTMDELQLHTSTALFATSDHGEFAGDYGLPEKWPNAMTDNLIHVPFVVQAPGIRQNHRVTGAIESFDLMATVLEMANITPKHTHFAQSLYPELTGQRDNQERYVFCEGGYDTHEPHAFEGYQYRKDTLKDPTHIYYPKASQQQEYPESVCRTVMIRNLKYKLIKRTQDVCELYDLQQDPMEIHNLYDNPAYTHIVQDLEQHLLDWYIRTADTIPMQDDPRGFTQTERRTI